MTLQDFFISGLPASNTATVQKGEQKAITTTDQIGNEQTRVKTDKKPASTIPKPTTTATMTTPTTESSRCIQYINYHQIFSQRDYFILASTIQPTTAPNIDADLKTRIDVIVKHPEIILLEDQHNSNSNCLVLDVKFLYIYLQIILQKKTYFS